MSGSNEPNQVRPAHGRSPFGRYRPAPHLSPFIRNYWTLAPTGEPGACRRQRVVPDGCIDIVLVRHSPTEVFQALVVGTMTRSIFEEVAAHAEYLGIRFAPGGFGHFFGTPASHLTDQIVPLEDLVASSALVEQVANGSDIRTRLRMIEDDLCQRLSSEALEPRLAKALDAISASRGLVSVACLAALGGWSPRHLHRAMREWVGVGPKTFCEIIRFKNALRLLRQQPRRDLVQVALEAGYYDQPHFIHDFNRFYGATPALVGKDPAF